MADLPRAAARADPWPARRRDDGHSPAAADATARDRGGRGAHGPDARGDGAHQGLAARDPLDRSGLPRHGRAAGAARRRCRRGRRSPPSTGSTRSAPRRPSWRSWNVLPPPHPPTPSAVDLATYKGLVAALERLEPPGGARPALGRRARGGAAGRSRAVSTPRAGAVRRRLEPEPPRPAQRRGAGADPGPGRPRVPGVSCSSSPGTIARCGGGSRRSFAACRCPTPVSGLRPSRPWRAGGLVAAAAARRRPRLASQRTRPFSFASLIARTPFTNSSTRTGPRG